MNIDTAYKIMADFGEVIEKTAKMGYAIGCPKSMLPHKEGDILQAMFIVAGLHSGDPKMISNIRTGIFMLGDFIDDDIAENNRRAMSAPNGTDKESIIRFIEKAQKEGRPELKMKDEIQQKEKKLIDLFDKYISGINNSASAVSPTPGDCETKGESKTEGQVVGGRIRVISVVAVLGVCYLIIYFLYKLLK